MKSRGLSTLLVAIEVILVVLSTISSLGTALAAPSGVKAVATLDSKFAREIDGGYWLPKNAPSVFRVAVTAGNKVTYKKTWEEAGILDTIKENVSKTIIVPPPPRTISVE